MEFAYSPGSGAGGTLHLSPSQAQHDPTIARNLRRSLSRSPSKPRVSRPTSPNSWPPRSSSTIPNTPTTVNPRLHASATDNFYVPSAKKARQTLRRTTPLGSISPITTPAAQSLRRALSNNSDNGNASVSPPALPADKCVAPIDGQENDFPSFTRESSSSSDDPLQKSPLAGFSASQKSLPLASKVPIFKPPNRGWRPVKSSPLKRSDAHMNLAQEPPSSPSAKRRTICGGVVSSPFGGAMPRDWDYAMADRDAEDSDDDQSSQDAPMRPPLASRNSTLRRTKAFVRQPDRPSALTTRRSLELARDSPKLSRPSSRNRQHPHHQPSTVTPLSRPEPSEPCLFDFADPTRIHQPRAVRAQPHPLSKTLSPTSPTFSENNCQATSEDHSTARNPSASPLDFSKSLPINSLRPSQASCQDGKSRSEKTSFGSSFATPKLYHIAKPDPAAFRSTGLISKKHRNPDDMPPPPTTHLDMPDTPCKRAQGPFNFATSPSPSNSAVREHRFSQPSFGTPFRSPGTSGNSQAGHVRHSSDLFGQHLNFSNFARRQSSFGADGDETLSLSQTQTDSQSSADELPPTPTKHSMATSNGNKKKSLRSTVLGRRSSIGPNTFAPPEEPEPEQMPNDGSPCRFTFLDKPSVSSNTPDLATSRMISSPDRDLRTEKPRPGFCSRKPSPRFRALSPLSQFCKAQSYYVSVDESATNAQSVCRPAPVRSDSGSVPQTPVDNSIPDPSGLSISPGFKKAVSPNLNGSFTKPGSAVPATPTHREVTAGLFNQQLMTPSNHAFAHDIDPILSRRFKKVEWYGKGNFSEVYKVSDPQESFVAQSYFDSFSKPSILRNLSPRKVFIVKRTKTPYTSARVRRRKLREAAIMSALGEGDHIVHLIDSWESSGHVYIQTELCEEGSLEQFLQKIGTQDRLDDFRIWKIMIELSEGVKHIHNNGFIHLDLKPANVFINFAGVLKIGDFGLAIEWPAPPHAEGEGDRRYMGPDLLQGAFDKPADIFALGMMMFEIAGNCNLPDNGSYWQHLRSGDWSGLPSLTSASSHSMFTASLDAMSEEPSLHVSTDTRSSGVPICSPSPLSQSWHANRGIFAEPELSPEGSAEPPTFMRDPNHPEALDQIVHWMMQPKPEDRPMAEDILVSGGCVWVNHRRRAGAIVFEGVWGPPDHVLTCNNKYFEDEIMTDAP